MALLRVHVLSCAFLFAAAVALADPVPASKYTLKETGNEWWRSAPIYQIYPLSFRDKDNDGRGDLQGIIEKLPYLKELGIVAVWLSPIYPSPMVDFGYDISDFRGINEWYGTMEDFDRLIQAAHDLGLKLLMDFVPNHSSDQHEWFQKSVNSEGNYTDYYVWRDPKGFDEDGNPIPPNNWLSIFRGRAWTYNEKRKQFYLHHFAPEQPDLNYRNPNVVQEMKDVILFWLKKGVDGFRIDAVPFLFEHPDLPDEPVHLPLGDDPLDAGYLDHIYTQNQPETFEMVQQWREVIDRQSADDGIDRCFMVEAYAEITDQMRYYGTPERPGANFPFNFNIIGTNNRSTAQELKRNIDVWFDNLPEGAQSNWVIGNHDQNRIGSKVGTDLIDGMNMIVTLLPGVSVTYYGEEIGMVNNDDITYEEGVDPQGCNYPPDQFYSRSRDFERTPMQWDATVNAGFNTGAKPWLPVNKNYVQVNVEAQKDQEYSHYTIYRELREADKLPVVQSGRLLIEVVGKGTLGLVRSLGSDDFLIALVNFTDEQEEINLDPTFLIGDRMLDVYTASANSGLQKKTQVSSTNITLAGKGSVVLMVPKNK